MKHLLILLLLLAVGCAPHWPQRIELGMAMEEVDAQLRLPYMRRSVTRASTREGYLEVIDYPVSRFSGYRVYYLDGAVAAVQAY